ncbi:MAG: DUF1577 domain-containing protein, partial [Spirochaetota bacterium]|nr:DUF1577 domain-containing protein [Spirochaetota bacterium]
QLSADLEIIYPDNNIRLWFKSNIPSLVSTKNDITVYTISNRYIEISLEKKTFDGNNGIFEFIKAKVASDSRKEQRVNVEHDDRYWVDNFRLSKYYIKPNIKDIPICVQVAVDKLKPVLAEKYPDCELSIYNEANCVDKIILASRKNMKAVYIEDVHRETSMPQGDTGFVDLKESLGSVYDKEIQNMKQKGISSLLIYPVIYTNIQGEKTPVAYFKMSKNSISPKTLTDFATFAQTLNSYIRDANVHIIKTPQKILNASKSGLLIKVANKEIMDIFLSHKNLFVLDIKPRPTYRLTLFAQLVNILVDNKNSFAVGVKLIGGEQFKGLEDWQDFVENRLL